jgi:hypothetical protein
MATKGPRKAATRRRGRSPEVTVEHLTNSLAQIELWVNAVRMALSGLDPKTVLPLAGREGRRWAGKISPIRIDKDCPPPE